MRGNPFHGTRHLETSPQRSSASILAQPPSPPSTVWSLFVAPVVFFLSSSSRTTKPSTRRTRERFVERRDRYTTVTGHVLSDRPNPRHAEHASVSSDDATMTHVRRAPRPIPAHPSRTSSTQNASFSSDDATATARAPATRASWPTSWPTCKSRWRVTYGVGAFATARNGQMCPWGRRAGRPRPTRPRRAPSPLGGGGGVVTHGMPSPDVTWYYFIAIAAETSTAVSPGGGRARDAMEYHVAPILPFHSFPGGGGRALPSARRV